MLRGNSFVVFLFVYIFFSVSAISEAAPKREFSEKFRPQPCEELDVLNYLFDCYERISIEERTAPKVRRPLSASC